MRHRRRRRRAKENPGFLGLIGILTVGAAGYLAYRLFKKPAALPQGSTVDSAADAGGRLPR